MGVPRRSSCGSRAFGNAALGHSLIYDDMHVMSGSHIGVMVIPAALALAQRDGWSGPALLRGLVGGYEMATHLGVAVRVGGRVTTSGHRASTARSGRPRRPSLR